MRPPSPLVGRSRIRSALRSTAYGLAAFSVLTLCRASYLLRAPLDEVDQMENPRYRRKVEVEAMTRVEPSGNVGQETPDRWGSDVFIAVKTTAAYHGTRLRDVLDTWFRLAPDKIWFFTDTFDADIQTQTDGHLVNTNCTAGHTRQALCCKMGVELDYFLKSGRRWMCHFDDDNYVNVPQLIRLLSGYDPQEPFYLGKPSTRDRIHIMDRDNIPNKIAFWFATGGAGFCLSRALGDLMAPIAAEGRFQEVGDRIRLPDDVTMGYIVGHVLQKELTVVDKFHSHLESMAALPRALLPQQVSLSAGSYSKAPNVVAVPAVFPADQDPARFRSLHCHLFPEATLCSNS